MRTRDDRRAPARADTGVRPVWRPAVLVVSAVILAILGVTAALHARAGGHLGPPLERTEGTSAVGRAARNSPWELALPGYRYEFPRDHFEHSRYQTEWWYYTGNLKAGDGHRFGFELTFFRQGITVPKEAETISGPIGPFTRKPEWPWQVDTLYLAHLALSDLDGRRFYHTERLNRAGPGLAGADLGARRIWNGNWLVKFGDAPKGGQPVQNLQAVCEEFTLQLALHSGKPPVIHGVNGVSQKASGPGQASHYISYTRLEAQGTLLLAGQKLDVSGEAWMDHEFFTHQLTPEQSGWDWFSVQLATGEELMLYRLRRQDGSVDPYSAGTYMDARGGTRHLSVSEFALDPGATWTSPQTGARYPLHWTVRVPSLGLTLEATTPLENQELVSRGTNAGPEWGLPTYWEGAIELRGTERGAPATGRGYLEMTGYDRPVRLGPSS